MERYQVSTTPTAELASAWDEYLTRHVAQVTLAGRFAGAEVVARDDGTREVDYSAPDGTLARYVEEHAPRFRQETVNRFPGGVTVSRETRRVMLRMSPPFEWGALGLVDSFGSPVSSPSSGPFLLVYWAPWCGDCRAQWDEIVQAVVSRGDRAALVSVFSTAEAASSFTAPVATWREPGEKTEEQRLRSFHSVLRQLTGDGRRWGVPAQRELWIEDGQFVVRWS